MNIPNDPAAALRERARELGAAVDAFDELGTIGNEPQAVKAGDLLREINALLGEIEKERKTEKAPHIFAGKQVDARFNPVRTVAEEWKGKVKALLRPWLEQQEEEAAQHVEQLRASVEIARVDAADASDEMDRVSAEAEVERRQAIADAADAKRAQIASQLGGRRAVSLRKGKIKVEVVDRDALIRWAVSYSPTFMTEQAAYQARQAFVFDPEREIPGVRITRERTVA